MNEVYGLDTELDIEERESTEKKFPKKAPTERQVNFAKTIGRALKKELPKERTAKAFSDFIDENLEAFNQVNRKNNKPTERQIEFAKSISEALGIEITNEFTFDAYSKFIATHKDDFYNRNK